MMYDSTYVYKAAVSKKNYITNYFSSRLTNDHFNDFINIICTNFTPNIKKLVKTTKCNFSY